MNRRLFSHLLPAIPVAGVLGADDLGAALAVLVAARDEAFENYRAMKARRDALSANAPVEEVRDFESGPLQDALDAYTDTEDAIIGAFAPCKAVLWRGTLLVNIRALTRDIEDDPEKDPENDPDADPDSPLRVLKPEDVLIVG
jgi:hypothetical protein